MHERRKEMIGILPLPYRAQERQLEVVVPTDWRCVIGMCSLLDHFANIDWCSKLRVCAINSFLEYVSECEWIHWYETYVEELLIPLTVLAPKRLQCTHISIAYWKLFYQIKKRRKKEDNFNMIFAKYGRLSKFYRYLSFKKIRADVWTFGFVCVIWMQQLVCIIALP